MHTLVSHASYVLVAAITNDVRMSDTGSTIGCEWVDVVGWPGNLGKSMSGVSAFDGLSTR